MLTSGAYQSVGAMIRRGLMCSIQVAMMVVNNDIRFLRLAALCLSLQVGPAASPLLRSDQRLVLAAVDLKLSKSVGMPPDRDSVDSGHPPSLCDRSQTDQGVEVICPVANGRDRHNITTQTGHGNRISTCQRKRSQPPVESGYSMSLCPMMRMGSA